MIRNIFIIVLFSVFFSNSLFAQQYMLYEVYNNSDVGFGIQDTTSFNLNFVCTGPLNNGYGIPIGGYIDNYHQTQNWAVPQDGNNNFSVRNGIFGVTRDGKPVLIGYDDIYKGSYDLKWAFQNGPILVEDSINLSSNSTSRNYRAGIGFKAGGKIIVIITKEALTFKEFSELFLKNGCINAIYLNGSSILGGYLGYSFGAGTNEQRLGLNFKKAIKLQFFHQGVITQK